jgi:hypothetical protein
MLRRTIKAIHYLRVYFLAFFIIVLFYYVGLQPVDVSKFIGAKFSRAVGMSTSVPENPFNKVALQLKEKEQQLNEKENALDLKADELAHDNYTLQTKLTIILIAGVALLFLLIMLNFYFDYKRKQQEKIFFINK